MALFEKSAIDLHTLFCRGELSAVEIAKHFLDRIARLDDKVGAFLTVYDQQIVKAAEQLDKKKASGEVLGKLAAIPIALKDNIHLKGELTTCASKFLANYKAVFDATVVKLIREQDGLFIGKTNMDEFAMGSSTENSALKKTRNPWNLECVPGGSSGGSAAAVASRLVPLALGSDTGGSVRQPASLCSVVGFKPTYGRVSRYGLVAFGSSLDQIGPLSHKVRDSALLMEVLGRHCENDATSIQRGCEDYLDNIEMGIKGLSIGVPWHFVESAEEESRNNFKNGVKLLEDLGAKIVPIDLDLLKYSIAVYYILATAEASTNLARFDGVRYGVRSPLAKTLDEVYDLSKEEGFGPEVKRRILLGTYVLSSGYKDAYYRKAQKVRAKIIQEFAKIFKTCQLICMPVSPIAAFKAGEIHDPLQLYLADIYTIPANLAGLPAVSVPSGFSKDKKPFGLQIIGPQLHDVLVLRAGHSFESASQVANLLPSMAL